MYADGDQITDTFNSNTNDMKDMIWHLFLARRGACPPRPDNQEDPWKQCA